MNWYNDSKLQKNIESFVASRSDVFDVYDEIILNDNIGASCGGIVLNSTGGASHVNTCSDLPQAVLICV